MFDGAVGIEQCTPAKDSVATSVQNLMQTSYRILAIVIFLAASTAMADGRFSAADVPHGLGIKKQGRIVIRNDERSITAYSFFGNVSKALVSLHEQHAPLRNVRQLGLRLIGASEHRTAGLSR